MNFEKIGSQQKRLVTSKSCSHLQSFLKKIKFKHFEFLKETYTTIVKNIMIIQKYIIKIIKILHTLIVFRKMKMNSSVPL